MGPGYLDKQHLVTIGQRDPVSDSKHRGFSHGTTAMLQARSTRSYEHTVFDDAQCDGRGLGVCREPHQRAETRVVIVQRVRYATDNNVTGSPGWGRRWWVLRSFLSCRPAAKPRVPRRGGVAA